VDWLVEPPVEVSGRPWPGGVVLAVPGGRVVDARPPWPPGRAVLDVGGNLVVVVDGDVVVVAGPAVVEVTVELDELVEAGTPGAVWSAAGAAGSSVSAAARTAARGSWGNIRAST
jgi:hypothetical protein